MRQQELATRLSKLRSFKNPKPELEQWATPGDLAAQILLLIQQDLTGRSVVDLGCGTGVLSIGASLLGARVTGVDADPAALEIAKQNAGDLDIAWILADVSDVTGRFDTVIMNPPFGAQRRHADRPFVETAIRLAPIVYSFHQTATRNFINQLGRALTRKVSVVATFSFPLKAVFAFHRKKAVPVPVDLLKFEESP